MKLYAVAVALLVLAIPLTALAEAPKCHACSMKIDDAHNIHFKYEVEGESAVHLGSLVCAKNYWSKHKGKKLSFFAKDFVTGKFSSAEKGFFLVGSRLKVGTGMDKGGAIFFKDRAMAEKAKKVNGGRIVPLADALTAVQR